MSQALRSGSEKYTGMIGRARQRHQDELKEICFVALYDTSLDNLDRAVLGFTGSPERLDEYRELDEKITANVGKPMVVVTEMAGTKVRKAMGGLILGGLETKLGTPLSFGEDADMSTTINSASMHVPVLPVASYQLSEQAYHRTYLNDETSEYDRKDKIGKIPVAYIRLDYDRGRDETGEYRMRDLIQPNLLIGREEIYNSDLFRNGVSHLLRRIEEE